MSPIVEMWRAIAIAVASVAAATSLVITPGLTGIAGAILALNMAAVAYVDARRFIIPDKLVLAAVTLGVVATGLAETDGFAHAAGIAFARAVAMAALFEIFRRVYRRLRGREGMGFGDVKLAFVAGVWLSVSSLPIAVEIAAVTGLVAALAAKLKGNSQISSTTRLPFGAFFAPAIWICWLFETAVAQPGVW